MVNRSDIPDKEFIENLRNNPNPYNLAEGLARMLERMKS